MIPHRLITRRSFMKRGAAMFSTVALPAMVPGSVLGAGQGIAPSNRIVMGAIGVGGMGRGDMNGFLSKSEVRMVAVCDVDKKHRDQAKQMADRKYGNRDCVGYKDYRELIGRGDLDAVQLALPDHWHAIPAIAAAKAGIDIHGQKPFARSIKEGRAICDAVHRYGRVWQTGSQQRSGGNFRRAAELVNNGRIGKVTHVEVGLPTGGGSKPQPVQAVPDGVDWEMWLGPAPRVPYRGIIHWNWRWIMDYSGGQLTDWCGHHLDIAHWGLGFDYTGPVEIQGKGDYPQDGGIYNVPMNYTIHYKYANGLPLSISNKFPMGAKWYGDKGWVHVNRGSLRAEPAGILKEVIGPDEKRLYVSRDHRQNFLDCIKTRKLCVAPAEVGHRSISVGLLGEIAMLTGRKIKWNPDTEEISGDPGASALLGRSYREPWTL